MKQTMWLSEFSSLSEYTRLYHISRWQLREEKINLKPTHAVVHVISDNCDEEVTVSPVKEP